MAWTSKTTYVDRETGEEITGTKVKKHYVKLKCNVKNERTNTGGIKHITWECERNRQTTLF